MGTNLPSLFYGERTSSPTTEVWGSLEVIHNERSRRLECKAKIDEDISLLRNLISKYKRRRETEWDIEEKEEFHDSKLLVGSGRIILVAIVVNASNFIIKLWACWMTGSQSMFAEAVHSLADTANQCILAYGIHVSGKRATKLHPYGYANMKNLASLVSGVGIFCVGAGLSIYHGIHGLITHATLQPTMWAYFLLAGAAVSESAPLIMGINEINKKAKSLKISFKNFVLRGIDPSLSVLLLEDFAALFGVVICGTCIGLSTYYKIPIPDAIGSLLIGTLLACVATFIIKTNGAALVGRSIPICSLEKMTASLESDVMIRAIHDVKGIDIGNNQVRYKAEIDFDGKELTRAYLDKQNIEELLNEIKKFDKLEDVEDCFLKHGEAIVDTIGAEIDRIEMQLKREFPEVRHADLEIL